MKIQNRPSIEGKRISKNIYLCPDEKYRWIYELDMIKNPIILFTIWKVLAISFGIVAIMTFLMILKDLLKYGLNWHAEDAKVLIIFILVFIGISIVAYLAVAKSYGWKYIVLFEMDENSIVHIQVPKQFKRAKAIGWLTAMAGLASGSVGRVGQGVLTATHDRTTSDFDFVKTIILKPRQNAIKVNYLFTHNQIYAEKEDFVFIANYICDRCPNAKIKGKRYLK